MTWAAKKCKVRWCASIRGEMRQFAVFILTGHTWEGGEGDEEQEKEVQV